MLQPKFSLEEIVLYPEIPKEFRVYIAIKDQEDFYRDCIFRLSSIESNNAKELPEATNCQ